MTCREFKHSAVELNLWELTRSEDAVLLSHADQCDACGGWLQKQRTLANSMQILQSRTSSLEAGPDVERALLRAFRQSTRQDGDPVFSEVRERSGSSRPVVMPLSTPMAMRLSRVFEVGSYVALAAALLVGVFLGLRLLQHSSSAATAQSQATPAVTEPAVQNASAAAPTSITESPLKRAQGVPVKGEYHRTTAQPAAVKQTSEDMDTLADAGYTDLMFCDPLSCSADTQIVRMELPATNGQTSQPQVADLVVGYDGVVRAVRLGN